MYVYLDETTFGENNEYSGYASLITKYRIETTVVNEALNDLMADPDIKKKKFIEQDSRTLQRKYFHAADDSQNGHSHLCNSINKNVTGRFNSHHFKTAKHHFKNIGEAYSLASQLSILSVFHESTKVTFIFEERNDLNIDNIKQWWKSLCNSILKSQFRAPYIRTFYPESKFEIRDKSEPGLQIVDFILWASTRQILDKDCPWFNRLKCKFKTEMKPETATWGGYSLFLGKKFKDSEGTYEVTDFHHDNKRLNSLEFLYDYIVNAQKVINSVANSGCQDGVSHFWNEIEYLKNTNIQKGNDLHIEKLATCFLKLFDNVTLIKTETSEYDKAFWLSCRKCLAYALHTHDFCGRIHSVRLSDIRNQIIESEPELLQQY